MRLSEWLKENGKTQDWLANEVGVTQGRISQLSREGAKSLDVIAKIKQATGGAVTADDFLPDAEVAG